MKVCSKCGIEKELSEFNKNKSVKDGYHYYCRKCVKEIKRISYKNNSTKILINKKEYYKNNNTKILINKKEYYQKNKERCKDYWKEYCRNNKEKINENNKEYYKNNKEKLNEYSREYNKEYYKNNKEKIKEYRENNKEKLNVKRKEWRENNKEKCKEREKEWRENNRERQNIYFNNKYNTNSLFKLKHNLRSRTLMAFKSKSWNKNGSQKMLGCTFETAHSHLEKQFVKGMNWSNQGEWHIDHIIPLASATTQEELIKLCHYTNLQPLWAIDNLIKSDKMPNVQIQLRI